MMGDEKGKEIKKWRPKDELKRAIINDNDIVKEAMNFSTINARDLYQEESSLNDDEGMYCRVSGIKKTFNDDNDDENVEDLLIAAENLALSLNRFLMSPQLPSMKSPSDIVSDAKTRNLKDGTTATATTMAIDGQHPNLNVFSNDWNSSPQKSAIDQGGWEKMMSSDYNESKVSKSAATITARCSSKEEGNMPSFPFMMGKKKKTLDPKIIEGAPELDLAKPEEMFYGFSQRSPSFGDESSSFTSSSNKERDNRNSMQLDADGFLIEGAPEPDLASHKEIFFGSSQHSLSFGDETSSFSGRSTKKQDRIQLDNDGL